MHWDVDSTSQLAYRAMGRRGKGLRRISYLSAAFDTRLSPGKKSNLDGVVDGSGASASKRKGRG